MASLEPHEYLSLAGLERSEVSIFFFNHVIPLIGVRGVPELVRPPPRQAFFTA